MAVGLPEGLVRNIEGVSAVEESNDLVQVELVAACWRGKPRQLPRSLYRVTRSSLVYSSNRAVLAENVGRRLENFFWRIWGSDRLRQRLTGTQVNIQFDIINEGGYIRTTPTASPRSSKSLSAYYKEARRRTPPSTPPSIEGSDPSGNDDTEDGSSTFPPASASTAGEKFKDDRPLSDRSNSQNKTATSSKGSMTFLGKSIEAVNLPTYIGPSPEDSSVTPTPTSPIAALDKSEETSKENRRTSQTATRRPPILKKESSGSSRSSKTAKIINPSSAESQLGTSVDRKAAVSPKDDPSLSVSTKSGSVRRPIGTRFNEEVSVSIPKPSSSVSRNTGERSTRSGGESSQKNSKRNPVVIASSAANKTKPAFVRQRSSVGAPKEVPSRSSSYQNLASAKSFSMSTSAGSQSGLDLKGSPEPASTKRSRAASPHPSKQRRQPSPDPPSSKEPLPEPDSDQTDSPNPPQQPPPRVKRPSNISPSPPTPKPLVDPNFRSKFIDRTRASQRSLTDLSAFNRKSSAAVPTSASYQATGVMESVQATSSAAGRGKGREGFTNVTAPLKGPAPAGPGAGGEEALPRTKSHLTLLLERERARAEQWGSEGRRSD